MTSDHSLKEKVELKVMKEIKQHHNKVVAPIQKTRVVGWLAFALSAGLSALALKYGGVMWAGGTAIFLGASFGLVLVLLKLRKILRALFERSDQMRGQLNALSDQMREQLNAFNESNARINSLNRVNKNSIQEQLADLSIEEKLSLAESLSVRVKLDYPALPIYLLINSISEYPRRLACQKEPWTVQWIEKYIKEGDVFFDVGANVGAYSLMAAVLTKGKAKIYSFEPAFFNYPALCRNITINNCQDSIVPFPFALSKSTHLDYFNYADLKTGSALHTLGEQINYRGEKFEAVYRQPIIAYSIDEMIQSFGIPVPNHIKIDVDGTEMDVLTGAEMTLNNPCVISMMLEISERKVTTSTIMSFLQPKGWSVAERFDRPGKPGQSDVSYLLLLRDSSNNC